MHLYANNSRGYVNGTAARSRNVAASDGVIQAYGGSIISIGQAGTEPATARPSVARGWCTSAQRADQGRSRLPERVAPMSVRRARQRIDPRPAGSTRAQCPATSSPFGRPHPDACRLPMPITNTTVARFGREPGVADRLIQLRRHRMAHGRPVPQSDGTTNQFAVTSVTGTTTQTDILAVHLLDRDFNEAGPERSAFVWSPRRLARPGTFTIGCSGTVQRDRDPRSPTTPRPMLATSSATSPSPR